MSTMEKSRCGFAAVVGLPNAGKSTLMNALVGSKVSIVSKRVQTTRCRVLGIVMRDNTQIVLADTPGIFAPEKTLEKVMVRAAWDALEGADVVVHLVDAGTKNPAADNEIIIGRLPQGKPVFLVLNKTDKINKPALLSLSAALNARHSYAATFMVSALKNQGVQDLLPAIAGHMPEGPFLFDPEQITDMPMRLMAAEITREKIYQQLYQELPYSVLVETEKWEDFKDGSVKIDQAIYVQKDSQKAIVLGKGGSRIRQLGEAARLDLETIMARRVHLKLFVKVEEGWSERAENYSLMGLDFIK